MDAVAMMKAAARKAAVDQERTVAEGSMVLSVWMKEAEDEVERHLEDVVLDWTQHHIKGAPQMAAEKADTHMNLFKFVDILKYWEEQKEKYPYVCVLACSWLGVPPAQSFVERSFSAGKIIMNRLRQA